MQLQTQGYRDSEEGQIERERECERGGGRDRVRDRHYSDISFMGGPHVEGHKVENYHLLN